MCINARVFSLSSISICLYPCDFLCITHMKFKRGCVTILSSHSLFLLT